MSVLDAPLSSGGAASANVPVQATFFGAGIDGAAVFDGVGAVTGASLVGSTYTLTRDVDYSSITVSSGVTVNTGGFRIYCRGTLTNAGTIHRNGNDGATGAAGGAGATALAQGSCHLAGRGAGSGGLSTANGGGATNSSAGLTDVGGNGATGGDGTGDPTTDGGAGSTLVDGTGFHGWRSLLVAGCEGWVMDAQISEAGGRLGCAGAGGGGGGGGSNPSGNRGGGGGGGAGVVVIRAHTIVNTGTISANGGGGGQGQTNSGRGGGGGGGLVIVTYGEKSGSGFITATKGQGGSGGQDGQVLLFQVAVAS